MHPILFQLGNFTIGTYGVMIVLGMLAGLGVTSLLARRRGLKPDFFYDLAFVLLLSGFLGARLVFILTVWSSFLQNPVEYIFSRSGFVFLGGFVAALAVGLWFTRRRGVPLLEAADIVAPALVLAHAFGRIGCFLAGCCYGLACPDDSHPLLAKLAVHYPLLTEKGGQPAQMFNFAYWGQIHQGLIGEGAAAPLPLVPVQLFESAGNVLICLILLWMWRRRRFSGQIFALYLMFYSVMRFGLEYLRGDADRGIYFGGVISTSQLISIGTLAAALAIWFACRNRGIVPIPENSPAAETGEAEPEPEPQPRPARRRG